MLAPPRLGTPPTGRVATDESAAALPRPARRRLPNAESAAWWALLALAVLSCVLMLLFPLGYDQGVFATNGDVVARGGRPYVDAWDVKGPLVFWFHAAIQLVLGKHAWGVRVVDVAFALLTSAMLWRRLRPLTSPRAALLAAAAWPVVVAGLNLEVSAQYELWIGTATLGVVVLLTRPGGYRLRELAICGALVGAATLVKPFFPALLAVPGVVVLLRRRRAWRALVGELALVVAACVVPVAAAVAVLWAQGALREAWNVYVLYNLRVYAPSLNFAKYPGATANHARVVGTLGYLWQPKVAVLVPTLVAGGAGLWRRDRTLAAAVLTWFAVGVGLVLLQNKFWLYHWDVVYPAALLLAAVGLHGMARGARLSGEPAPAALALATAAVLVVLWGANMLFDAQLLVRYALGRKTEAQYYGHFDRYGELNAADERAAAAYLRAHTPPGAPMANWTLHAGLPFMADRPDVSRIHNKRELTKLRQHPVVQGYRREFLARVEALRPAYVAVDTLGDSAAVLRSPDDALAREFPEFAAYVARNYRREVQLGEITLYRRRPDADVAPPRSAVTATVP